MKRNIKVIGLGGGACNIIRHLQANYKISKNVKVIGSDSATCGMRDINNKLPLERVYPIYCRARGVIEGNSNNGRGDIMCCIGCNGNEILGELSAWYKYKEIKEELEDTDILIIISMFGGGTGTGAIKIYLDIAKELNIETICIIGLPLKFESKKRLEKAMNGIEAIKENVKLLVTIEDSIIPKKSIVESFKEADQEVSELIQLILLFINRSRSKNLDYQRLERIIDDQ